MSEAVLQAKIKAFDEFTSLFQKYQSELKKVGSAQNEAATGAKNANKSVGDFLTTVGSIGAFYAFQQALRATMNTGRDFELTIKQAQAVTGDFSSTLRDLAMATKGGNLDTFGPTQLAEAYRELGAAGATTNDIMAATPDILEFGTAALLDMDQAAFGVLATAKSFNMAISDSGQIVDAYTQAMNQGALAGQDFQWIMSSAGAVAKMTGQDFREILSIGSAMRDSGIQAQDAGTAIKSALMALMNPSNEALQAMKDLGISIYDSSGQMKQWSEITAEFERALGPLDEQSRQLALGTIFGADGIRTMAISMNKGSDYLRTFTEGLKTADGATHEMASAMSDTYDGAAKKFNASLERTKILLFEDIAPAAGVALGALNNLLLGFQSLDEGTRHFIEVLVGGAGLVAAIGAVTTAIRSSTKVLALFGAEAALATGPIGIAVAAIGVLTGAYLMHKGAVAQSTLEQANNIKTIEGQINTIPALVNQYESLINNTKRTAAEEAALRQVTADLAGIMPEAVSGFDSFGNAIFNTGNLADVAKGKISALKQEVVGYYKLKADMAQDQLPELNKQFNSYNDDLQKWQKQLQVNSSGKWDINLFGKTYTNPLAGEMGNNDYVQEQIRGLQSKQAKLYEDKIQLERDMAIYDSISKGTYWDKPSSPASSSSAPGSSWAPSKSGGGGSKNTTLDAAKSLTEAIDNAILPYRNAVELAGIAVGTLSSKEQFLTQVIEGGNGTAADAIALNQTRVEQFVKLSQQQDSLHQQAEAERVALAKVQEQLAAANNPEVVKELQSEMVNLERSIAQAGQAWVQAEQQKIAMMNRIKAEEEKRYSDAYQKAMDLMRHQINMANMSTEEQIRYLEKLRDAHEWTQQQMWELEESLYQLRRQQLTEMLDEIDEEYQSQLDRIEARTDKAAKAIQDQIDALDQTSQDNSRADAQYRYNQKIQELMDKRRYHELRTGKDHAEAIAEIDKEIAEAQREWELQQQEWAIEDQKESLQDQLEQVKEEGEKERDELEEHYRKAKRITESGVMDIIATLAATSPEWMNTGKQLIDALIAGLESGDFSNVQDIIDEVRDNDPETKTDPEIDTGGDGGSQQNPFLSITPASYRRYGNTTAMWSQNLAQLLGVSVSWDQSRGQVLIGGKAFTPLENDNGRTYVSIRQVAEALGYRVEWNDPNVDIYKAAKGGIFTKPALSMMAEAGGSEVAMPLASFQPMLDIAVMRALSQNGGSGTIINYNAPLFNSEKTIIDDETKSEIVARDIVGLQKSAMRGRGY